MEEVSLTSVADVHQQDSVCEIVFEKDMVKQIVWVAEVSIKSETIFEKNVFVFVFIFTFIYI